MWHNRWSSCLWHCHSIWVLVQVPFASFPMQFPSAWASVIHIRESQMKLLAFFFLTAWGCWQKVCRQRGAVLTCLTLALVLCECGGVGFGNIAVTWAGMGGSWDPQLSFMAGSPTSTSTPNKLCLLSPVLCSFLLFRERPWAAHWPAIFWACVNSIRHLGSMWLTALDSRAYAESHYTNSKLLTIPASPHSYSTILQMVKLLILLNYWNVKLA